MRASHTFRFFVATSVLCAGIVSVPAQWLQNTGTGPYNFPAVTNWNAGAVNNLFLTNLASGVNITFANDFTFGSRTILGFGTSSSIVNLKSSSATTHTLKLAGGINITNSGGVTLNVGTTANPLVLDLNGVSTNVLGGPATGTPGSANSTMNVYAQIIDSSGLADGLSLSGGRVFTYLYNTNNSFIGPVNFQNLRGGGFSSIKNIGAGASALGAPTDTASGTISVTDGTSNGSLKYSGAGDTSDRPFIWNMTFASTLANAYAFQNAGSGKLTLSGQWTLSSSPLTNTFIVSAASSPIELDGYIKGNAGLTYLQFAGSSNNTITLGGTTNDFGAFEVQSGVVLTYNTVSNTGLACSLGTNDIIYLRGGTLEYVGSKMFATNSRTLQLTPPGIAWNVDNGTTNNLVVSGTIIGGIYPSGSIANNGLNIGTNGPAGPRTLALNVFAASSAAQYGSLLVKSAIADITSSNALAIVAGSPVGLPVNGGGVVSLLNAASTFSGGVQVEYGRTLNVMSLADSNVACSIGTAGVTLGSSDSPLGGTLAYIGISDVTSCNRQICVAGSSTSGQSVATLLNNSPGNNSVHFSCAQPVYYSGVVSNCLFTLDGSANAINEFDSPITNTPLGAASLAVNGSTWIVAGTQTYAGSTTVSGGALLVNGVIGGSGVTVAGGGTLGGGSGTITSPVVIQSGGTLNPGFGAVNNMGTVTISNSLVFADGSTTIMAVNRTNVPSASKVTGLTTVTFGGTLTVTNLGTAFQTNDTFTLFSAGSYSGSFNVVNLPQLPAGMIWNTNSLAVNGKVTVTNSPYWTEGYYPGYRLTTMPASNIDFTKLTHVVHFSVMPTNNGALNWTDNGITTNGITNLIALAHAAGRKVLICVGGAGSEAHFLTATASTNLSKFVSNVTSFVATYNYDGVDIDWESLPSQDDTPYSNLVTQLRSALPAAKLLTTAWAPYYDTSDTNAASGYKMLNNLQGKFDQINLMTYDMSGPWSGWKTWHNSPLYNYNGTKFAGGKVMPSIDYAVNTNFIASGILSRRIGIGVAFYGMVWTGSTTGITGPYQAWPTNSVPTVTAVTYNNIISTYYNPTNYNWDTNALDPYLSIPNAIATNSMFISYDDERACQDKINYVRNHNLGGLIIWELSQDFSTGQQPLLQAINSAWSTFKPNLIAGGGQPVGLPFSGSLPLIGYLSRSPAGLTVNGSGGVPDSSYYVRGTTNMALPMGDWSLLATNMFDHSGNFEFTLPVDESASQQYISIQLP